MSKKYDKIAILAGYGYWLGYWQGMEFKGMEFKRAPNDSNKCIVEDTSTIQNIAPDPSDLQKTFIILKNKSSYRVPNVGLLYINNNQ